MIRRATLGHAAHDYLARALGGDQLTSIAYTCRACGWKSGPVMHCLSVECCFACDSVDLKVEDDLPDPPLRAPMADLERLRLIIDVMKQRVAAMFTWRTAKDSNEVRLSRFSTDSDPPRD